MTEDNNQDRSQSEGQEGIDRETELRNRENETGQAQNQQFGQDTSQPTTAQNQDSGTSSFGQQGQSAGGDTSLAERTGQTGGQALTGQTNPEGFVGSDSDDSSDYLTKGEAKQDFASQGQGAKDIETGQSSERDAELDDGSDINN
jgi:hypothetical protein